MISTLLMTAGLALTAAPADPEAAAEAAFATEATATYGTLEHVACAIDPAGGPTFCYGVGADGAVILGFATPGTPFTFGTFAQAAETGAASLSFDSGLWLVGTDIQPGTYRATELDGCYWERLSGLDGTIDSIIANDFIIDSGQAVVEISESDVAFSSEGCGTWEPVA